jgi:hypothetical protein
LKTIVRLSDDWRSLLEMFRGKASLLITTHPEAEQIIKGLTNYRLYPITDDSRVIVDPLSPEEGVQLVKAYLQEFRVKNFRGDDLAPFDKKGVIYLAEQTRGNPRALIGALRVALRIAAEKEIISIDHDFVASPVIKSAMIASAAG